MGRRLYVQFGVLIVAGVCATSTAYADAAADGSSTGLTSIQSQTTDISATGDGSTQVTSSTQSSQSVDGTASAGTNVPPAESTEAPSSAGLAESSIESSSTAPSIQSANGNEISIVSASFKDAGLPLSTASQQLISGIRPSAGSRISLAMQAAVIERQLAIQLAVLATPETAVVPQPAAPSAPQTPVDILSQLRWILTSSTLPAPQEVSSYHVGLVGGLTTLNAHLILTVLVAIATSLLLVDFYTARLRRAGYSVAARSDVGDDALSFVTPPKMGFIGSFAT